MRAKNRVSLKVIYKLLVGFLAALSLFSGSASAQNPVPLINQPLVPQAIAPSSAGFTLTVNGTGFASGAVVNWNGSPRTTTFVSQAQLKANILASDIATAETARVTVLNPGPGGGASNVAFFEVTPPTSSLGLVEVGYATADRSYAVAVGDFNGDGKPDLAVANYASGTISVLLGNGDGTFQPHVDYATGRYPESVAVGDFNSDGKLDLVVVNNGSNTVSILLGNGDGTFQPQVEYATENSPLGVAVADFNRDGKLDLVVANLGAGNVSVLLGKGDGTFQPAVSYGVGTYPQSPAVGDFNRDGKLDLAVANNGSNTVSILLGNGDGTFQPAVSYSTGPSPTSIAVADFNADDKLDLAVGAGTGVSVLLGSGDGTFQPHVDYGTGSSNPCSVAVGDFNGDGRPDLVVADLFSTDVRLLLGNGDGTFAAAASYAAGSRSYPSSVAVGDFNGDGRLDIAVADSGSATVSVLLQPTVFLSTPGLTFAGQVVGTRSSAQQIGLTNIGNLNLSIAGISISGINATDFSETNNCPSTLATGALCTIDVTFAPTQIGPRTANVTITDNAPNSLQSVGLSGIGVVTGPNVTLSTTSLSFATQLVGTSSSAQTVTLNNYGSTSLSITSIAATGDFSATNACGLSVAPGASCTINVTFKPTQIDARSGTLLVSDNASGSPQKVSLIGEGTVVKLAPQSLSFSCRHGHLQVCPPISRTTTLTNTGSLTISSISISGAFSQTNNCPSQLRVGASCTITVTFRSGFGFGTFTGAVSISDNGGASPQQVALSATVTMY